MAEKSKQTAKPTVKPTTRSVVKPTAKPIVKPAVKPTVKQPPRRQPNRIQSYFREMIGELKKVNWPTRQEAWNLTLVVLAVLVSMSALLGVFDFLFTQFFALILA